MCTRITVDRAMHVSVQCDALTHVYIEFPAKGALLPRRTAPYRLSPGETRSVYAWPGVALIVEEV